MILFKSIFAKPDPRRFAPQTVPVGWNPPPEVKAKKRDGNGVYLIDDATKTFGFADKPFETVLQNLPEAITEADAAELRQRGLDPYNPAYAAAKAIFARNPDVSKKELAQQIPVVAKETFKDVLAAFRAAGRSPIAAGGGGV